MEVTDKERIVAANGLEIIIDPRADENTVTFVQGDIIFEDIAYYFSCIEDELLDYGFDDDNEAVKVRRTL